MEFKTFDNGLRAVCAHKTDSNVCAVVVHITGGCQSEKNNQSGISEYLSRLLLCGTRTYPTREALSNYVKLNGIILKSHASRESITLSAICSNETLEQAIELLSDIVFESEFSDEAADKVRQGLLADIERLTENHNYALENSVNKALFYRTGLANPKYGTALTVSRFNASIAEDFLNKILTPKNTVIAVTGDVDEDDFMEYAQIYFADKLPDDEDYKKIKYVSEVEDFSGSLRTRNKRLNQSRISFAFPLEGYKSSKKYLPQIIKPILLNKLRKGLRLSNYFNSIDIDINHFANNGKIEFEAAVDYEYAETFITHFLQTLRAIITDEGISEEEFELEKNIFETNFLYKYDDVLEQSLLNAKEVAILKRPFNENSERMKIDMLSSKDANKFMAETFNFDKMFISYLGHPISLTFEDLLKL